ncbi:alpha/beta hydrolase family protein [Kitasatospora sp. NPDC087315]|uniref:alpha/beta hydrolase family protein n=1 Tax=Kitasatospora sp. NPDC087315 TaxID=3364069 RepID=UPI003821A72B
MIRRRSLLALAGLGGATLALPTTVAQAVPAPAPALTPAPAPAPATGRPRAITLPAPTGDRPVGTVDLHLVDRSRRDPFAPVPGPRELMVQLWYPALGTGGRPRAPYTTARVAAVIDEILPVDPGTISTVRPSAHTGAPAVPGPLPLLLLGHGRTGGRSNCTALAEELASHGYLVAAIDHTYDAAAVEFPDGRLVRTVLSNDPPDRDATERKEIAARVGDLRFVATELTARRPGRPSVDPRRIGVLGHSMGGAAAAEAVRQDPRFVAGLNLDGGLFGSPVPELGLDRPFLMLTSIADHDTWQRWREHQRGWGRQLRVGGAGHLSYTDLVHVAVPGGLPGHVPADLYAAIIGTLAPARATELTRAYTRAYFDRFLGNRRSPLLDGPSTRFPEIEFRWSHG